MKLERLWSLLGVYWACYFLASAVLPYEMAYLFMLVGYYASGFAVLFSVTIVLGRKVVPSHIAVKFKQWWESGYTKT